jgi:hypothetical protein
MGAAMWAITKSRLRKVKFMNAAMRLTAAADFANRELSIGRFIKNLAII